MSNPTSIDDVIAKIEIGEALARYCRGIDRHDFALAKSAYHEDGYDEHGPARGNAFEVMDRIDIALKNIEASRHMVSNILIELDGDIAHVESCFLSLHVEKNADREEYTFGRYLDRFERRGGDWKIAHRRVVVDYTSCPPRGEPFPHAHAFSQGRRDRVDPSYARA